MSCLLSTQKARADPSVPHQAKPPRALTFRSGELCVLPSLGGWLDSAPRPWRPLVTRSPATGRRPGPLSSARNAPLGAEAGRRRNPMDARELPRR
jgi:hypothetical protein